MSRLSQLGAVSEAPFRPHLEHLVQCRSTSLDASFPQRMMKGVKAAGARCKQRVFRQFTHNQQACLRIS
jgi:hypothetical protein